MERNCFGSPGPARTPAPAATTITPTSGSELAGELTDPCHPHDYDAFRRDGRARRHKRAVEPLPGRLGESPLDRGHRPDLTTQAHLAEEQRIGGDRSVGHARH